eukprot:2911958-Pyramimonas_sp.AAC.1
METVSPRREATDWISQLTWALANVAFDVWLVAGDGRRAAFASPAIGTSPCWLGHESEPLAVTG